jgi:hypothetical protein
VFLWRFISGKSNKGESETGNWRLETGNWKLEAGRTDI